MATNADATMFAPYVPPQGYTPEQAYGPRGGLSFWSSLGQAAAPLLPHGGTQEYLARRQAYLDSLAPVSSPATINQPAHPLAAIAPTPFSPTTQEAPPAASLGVTDPRHHEGDGASWDTLMADIARYPVANAQQPAQPSAIQPYMDPSNPAAVQGAAFAYGMNPAAARQYLVAQSSTPDASAQARAQQLVSAGVDPYMAMRQARAEFVAARPAVWDRYLDSGVAATDQQTVGNAYQREMEHALVTGDPRRVNALLAGLGSFAPYGEQAVSMGRDGSGQPYMYSQTGGRVQQVTNPLGYYASEGMTPQQDMQARQQAAAAAAVAQARQQQANAEIWAKLFGPLGPALVRASMGGSDSTNAGNLNAALRQIDAHRKSLIETPMAQEQRDAEMARLNEQYAQYAQRLNQILQQQQGAALAPEE